MLTGARFQLFDATEKVCVCAYMRVCMLVCLRLWVLVKRGVILLAISKLIDAAEQVRVCLCGSVYACAFACVRVFVCAFACVRVLVCAFVFVQAHSLFFRHLLMFMGRRVTGCWREPHSKYTAILLVCAEGWR